MMAPGGLLGEGKLQGSLPVTSGHFDLLTPVSILETRSKSLEKCVCVCVCGSSQGHLGGSWGGLGQVLWVLGVVLEGLGGW